MNVYFVLYGENRTLTLLKMCHFSDLAWSTCNIEGKPVLQLRGNVSNIHAMTYIK